MLRPFCLFLCCFLGVFNSPVAHGLLGLNPSLRLRFISKNASLVALYIRATTHGRSRSVVPEPKQFWMAVAVAKNF